MVGKKLFLNKNKEFKVVSFVSKENNKMWTSLKKKWMNYFLVEPQYFSIEDFDSKIYKIGAIDILFLDVKISHKFTWKHYNDFQKMNKQFKLVIFKKEFELKVDANIYKNNADDIVYIKTERYAKWNSIAVLRRYWNIYSKPTTKIYKGIVADFVENKFIVDGKNVNLTRKEVDMLRFFMNNIKEKITKAELYKKIWNFSDVDNSRVVDQILFKLKNKIGKEYFHTSRITGVSFS